MNTGQLSLVHHVYHLSGATPGRVHPLGRRTSGATAASRRPAVGNLFGSNAVNMMMFVPLDLAHGAGPILGAVSPVHVLSALTATILMALGLADIIYRAEGRFSTQEPGSVLMVLTYAAGALLVCLGA